jgi:S1-C subfamily serine protease
MRGARHCLPIVLLLLPVTAVGGSIESVFEAAARYTVKVETITEHPFLDDFQGRSFGAGFLVDRRQGWILTNRHVVAEAPSRVDVRFIDSDYLRAEKLYLDPQVDLAVIRIPPASIPDDAIEAELGCDETPQMGNEVVIFGHPSGLNFTGTRGIISGTSFVGGNESLQTDAPLNSGNSGGPLISIASGRVVGVSEARYDAEESEGLNLTVSIRHACRILELMAAGKDPSPPALPIVFVEHDSDNPRLVVANGYFADRSLLRHGDVILGIDGEDEPTRNIDQLKLRLRGRGGEVGLSVERGGQRLRVAIPLEPEPRMLDREALGVSGMTLLNYRPVDRAEGGFDDRVIVAHVASGSPAFDAWFEKRDSIYSINGTRVGSIAEVRTLLAPFENNGAQAIFVVRVPSESVDRLYDYHQLSLRIVDLETLRHAGP